MNTPPDWTIGPPGHDLPPATPRLYWIRLLDDLKNPRRAILATWPRDFTITGPPPPQTASPAQTAGGIVIGEPDEPGPKWHWLTDPRYHASRWAPRRLGQPPPPWHTRIRCVGGPLHNQLRPVDLPALAFQDRPTGALYVPTACWTPPPFRTQFTQYRHLAPDPAASM